MLFTVVEDLTQAFHRKVISDTHKSLLCCGWCESRMEIVFKSQSEKGSPLRLVKITVPKLFSLWAKEPWPRVTGKKNTGEKSWLQYLPWERGPGWGLFFQGHMALPEPAQHAPWASPQQCEHLARSAASAAGQSRLSTDSQLEHKDGRELKSVIRKLKTGWKLEISCTYPGDSWEIWLECTPRGLLFCLLGSPRGWSGGVHSSALIGFVSEDLKHSEVKFHWSEGSGGAGEGMMGLISSSGWLPSTLLP